VLNYDLRGFGLLLEHGKATRHQAVAPDALLVTNGVALLSALEGGCVEALGLVLDTLGNGERSLPLGALEGLIDGVEESVSVDHSSFCAKQSGKRAVGAARVRAR
jgi:hypothetical protein